MVRAYEKIFLSRNYPSAYTNSNRTQHSSTQRALSNRTVWRTTIYSLLLVLSAVIGARAQTTDVRHDKQAPVKVSHFDSPPEIDGTLNEEVWRQAAALTNFVQTQPADNAAATHPTEVRFGYDAKFFYIGIRAFDEKNKVRSTVAKRDDLSGNDYVSVWLDTINDNRRADD